ncbi:spore coat U domain-containing protein [Thioalkalivibrio sp. ALJT]|uniref:Csu type fimbrial protein n=1 Tax=Thioalkalivibrio sp. ALJT TaxID=1158146 RepID=UPI0018CAEB50|nr:spore coat U domain-containing protein [Thioalkalivibrio sp. ALJT]
MRIKRQYGFGALCVLLATSGTVSAQQVSDDFDVTITLEDSCELTTAPTDLSFGTVGLLNTDHTATSTVAVTCTDGAAYDLVLNAGLHDDGTTRRMEQAGEHVSYRLYSDSGFTALWGNDTTFGSVVSATGTGEEAEFTVHGRVESADNASTPPGGTYSDTVTIEVSF